MHKTKVLICYQSSQYGGVEKHILDIINGLSSEFDIFVACPEGPLVKDYLSAGAVKHFNLYPKFEADFNYVYKLYKIIKAEKISIIHSHELLSGSLGTCAGWIAGCKKRIYHVHTSFTQWRYSGLKKYPALIINTIVNFVVGNVFATDVIALTKSVKSTRVNREFINPSKIRVIPNGIYLKEFGYDEMGRHELRNKYNITESQFVIGNIARFTSEKGHEVLINAFKLIRDTNETKDYVLMLAGGGALLNELQLKVEQYDLADKVKFLGNFNETDKNKILSAFDCFVFPSYAEGFGIALVEAMATGIPSISSDIASLQDVGNDSVIYFKSGMASSLKEKIVELSENEEELKSLRQKGKKVAEHFSIENFWKAYINLYNL